MLLPDNDAEDEIEEPEINLVEMLKEYKKYRALSENLQNRELLGRDTFKRQLTCHYDLTHYGKFKKLIFGNL